MRFLVGVVVALAAAGGGGAALAAAAPPAAASSAPAWTTLSDPFPAKVTLRCVATFGTSGVALLGSSSSIAISNDGGATWKLHTTSGGQALRAIAFADANHGFAVDPPGTILETTNGGATWARDPSTTLARFSAVAASSKLVCALGATSISATTTPAAPSWTVEASPPPSPSSIVCDATGFAAAAGAGGTIMTRNAATVPGTWTTTTLTPSNAVVALALAPSPAPSPTPDLFAVSATGVQGSDDQGATFTALPARPASTSASKQLSAAYLGGPQPMLLVGGQAGLLERYEPASDTWQAARGPLAGDIVACAAGPGSVAYAISAAGIERTLSHGDPASTLTAKPATVTAGDDVQLTGSSPIVADGSLIIDYRWAGGSWRQMVSQPWSSSSPPSFPAVSDEPLSTTQYRVRFLYAGKTAMISPAVTVGVRPDIVVNRSSLRLRKGAVYRLTGQVFPAESGASVTIWTNRGRRWHRVTIGGTVRLSGGSTLKTRLFGTPQRQRYLLQVRMAANSRHLAAVSSLIRVTIR